MLTELKDLSQVRILGRTAGQLPLALFWAGSGLEFSYAGTTLSLEVETDYTLYEPWLSVEMNGQLLLRMPLPRGRHILPILRYADPDCACHIRILKETQPMPDDPSCHVVLHSLSYDGEFSPLPPCKHRIEFIGDSITSGEGLAAICPRKGNWGSMYLTPRGSYSLQIADALHADFRLISQCGWGVLCSWDNNPAQSIPRVYDKICGSLGGAVAGLPYNFSSWPTDAVIIHLGTNDACGFTQPAFCCPDGSLFKLNTLPSGLPDPSSLSLVHDAAVHFIGTVRRYNPAAHIVWTYGMMGALLAPTLQSAVADYAACTGDHGVSYCPLPETSPAEFGAHLHPGPVAHTRAAEILTKHLSQFLP